MCVASNSVDCNDFNIFRCGAVQRKIENGALLSTQLFEKDFEVASTHILHSVCDFSFYKKLEYCCEWKIIIMNIISRKRERKSYVRSISAFASIFNTSTIIPKIEFKIFWWKYVLYFLATFQ